MSLTFELTKPGDAHLTHARRSPTVGLPKLTLSLTCHDDRRSGRGLGP